jgi:hypothetical protein
MSDMSSAARQLIARTRDGDDPCPEDERRVGLALGRRIASGALATGALTTAAKAASLPAAFGLGKSIVLLTIVVGAAAGVIELRRASSPADSAPVNSLSVAPVNARAPSVLPARAETTDPAAAATATFGTRAVQEPVARGESPAPSRDDAVAPPVPPERAVARFDLDPASSGTAKDQPTKNDQLAAEAAALRTAQQAMRSGRTGDALRLLDQQDALYRAGSLGQERAAARVLALCEMGSVAAARAAAQRFEQQWPRSPLLGRVRSACESR